MADVRTKWLVAAGIPFFLACGGKSSSSTICQNLASAQSDLSGKVTACSSVTAAAVSIANSAHPTGQTCEQLLANCTSAQKQAFADLVTCFESLPTCTSDREANWIASLNGCDANGNAEYACASPEQDAGTASGAATTLVAGEEGPLRGIAVDDSAIYWASAHSVKRAGKDGRSPAILASGLPQDIAVDGSSLYWTDSSIGGTLESGVAKLPSSGGSPTTLATTTTKPRFIALGGTDVFWTSTVGVYSVPKAGGKKKVIADQQNSPWGIAVDGDSVYWANEGSGSILKAPYGGGAPVVLASDQVHPRGIALDRDSVYWTNYGDGTINRVPKSGGAVAVLASRQDGPLSIVVSGGEVFWANLTGGTIMKLGIGPLASGQKSPSALALDGANVYWTNSDLNSSSVTKTSR